MAGWQPEMPERKHAGDPLSQRLRSGRAAAYPDSPAPAPKPPTAKDVKEKSAAPPKDRARFFGCHPRQWIKTAIPPAGNAREKARRSVLGKALGVLGHAERGQPLRDVNDLTKSAK